jgi:hypothetical protein
MVRSGRVAEPSRVSSPRTETWYSLPDIPSAAPARAAVTIRPITAHNPAQTIGVFLCITGTLKAGHGPQWADVLGTVDNRPLLTGRPAIPIQRLRRTANRLADSWRGFAGERPVRPISILTWVVISYIKTVGRSRYSVAIWGHGEMQPAGGKSHGNLAGLLFTEAGGWGACRVLCHSQGRLQNRSPVGLP